MSDKPLNLAIAAQEVAGQRLENGVAVLLHEDGEGDLTEAEYRAAAAELSAPYCGCITCIVREVIDAAWPYLSVYAVMQYQDAMNDPEVRAQIDRTAELIRTNGRPHG